MATECILDGRIPYIAHVFGPWAHLFEFILIHHLEREKERELGRTKTRQHFMTMAGGMT